MGSVHVTVTVEIHQDDSMHNFYDTGRPTTPLYPTLPLTPVNTQSALPLVPNPYSVQESSTSAFAEAAVRTVANNEMHRIHTVFTMQEPPASQM
jgi:hypothetical protein